MFQDGRYVEAVEKLSLTSFDTRPHCSSCDGSTLTRFRDKLIETTACLLSRSPQPAIGLELCGFNLRVIFFYIRLLPRC